MKLKWGVIAALALALSGCSAVSQIEGQAFAVSMAVDAEAGGGVTVSVQYPSYGSKEAGGDEKGKGDYLVSFAGGGDFESALFALNAAIPRALNLTQLKSLIVSEELASSGSFAGILRRIRLAHRVNGGAGVVVVTGRAADFLAAQRPLIGLRLSDTLAAAMDTYERLGSVPRSTISEVFYGIESIYGDPVAALAAVAGKENENAPGDPEDALAGGLNRRGENRDEYFGAALFRGGVIAGRLTGGETQLLRLVRGGSGQMPMEAAGTSLRASRCGPLSVWVELEGDAPRIDVSFTVGVEDAGEDLDGEAVARALEEGLERLTGLCQRLETDPFGYARYAAARFLTVESWLAYDWRSRFPQAEVRYSLTVERISR